MSLLLANLQQLLTQTLKRPSEALLGILIGYLVKMKAFEGTKTSSSVFCQQYWLFDIPIKYSRLKTFCTAYSGGFSEEIFAEPLHHLVCRDISL
ncbi:hypothetical protein QJS04_geneDACA007332 [Acorus gramineus]|uniref:Uncharacterized protein n=1 Tax=Acorus gramineus TaxID=55184 RepID=A0AAV9BPY7_ACOGR|nr:hypothetical protein QJS04_geneDACA007332 [Acorus gramineus]